MPVLHAKEAMWSRKQSVCSGVSGGSKGDEASAALAACEAPLYPFAMALRVRVLQIVCGIGGMVVGAVGWLEERQKPALGLGVPAGAITILAAATSVYYSRGFGGWVSARSRSPKAWGTPWRALGPSPCAAVPLALLWAATVVAHVAMLTFCVRSLLNIGHRSRLQKRPVAKPQSVGRPVARGSASGLTEQRERPSPCAVKPLALLWVATVVEHVAMLTFCIRSLLNISCGTTTCVGVAGAQLSLSVMTLAAQVYMVGLDLRFDAAVSPPTRHSDTHTCTAVSMVPLTSVAAHSGGSSEPEPAGGNSPGNTGNSGNLNNLVTLASQGILGPGIVGNQGNLAREIQPSTLEPT